MSSDAESAASDEAPVKVEKASGRRNPRRSSRNTAPKKKEETPEPAAVKRRTRKRTDSHSSDSETRQTRSRSTRNRKKSGSPNYRSRRGAANDASQETPATRVKSARRASSRVNYKESEGEEDIIHEEPKKDEDEYDVEEDYEDSDEEKKKKELLPRRNTRTRKSSSSSPSKESKSKGRSKGRQAPTRRSDTRRRKKYVEEDDEEEEEEEEIEEQESNSNDDNEAVKTDAEKMEVDEADNKKKEGSVKKEIATEEKSSKEEKKEKQDEEEKEAPKPPESKPTVQEPLVEKESLKRKATEELSEESKKPKVDSLGEVKENPAYLRKSPVIVENKQFIDSSSKEVSGETQSNTSLPPQERPINLIENQHKATTTPSTLNLNGLATKDGMVFNPSVSPEQRESLKGRTFSLMAYNVADFDSGKPTSILEDLKAHSSDIICFQSLPLSFYSDKLEPTFKQLGYSGVINDSLITLFQSAKFQLVNNSAISLQSIVAKNLEDKSSDLSEATKKIFNDCYGKAQLVELKFVPENLQLNVCNLALPTQLDPSSSTLLMCRLLQAVDSSPGKPLILCGQFAETNWVSQLLECGKLSEEITKEMMKRKDVATIKNIEPKSLIELIPSLYECPLRQYINCFTSIMGPQVGSTNPVQLWISSLQTIAVSSPSTILASIAFAN